MMLIPDEAREMLDRLESEIGRLRLMLVPLEMHRAAPETRTEKLPTPAEWAMRPHVSPCTDEPPGVDL